MEEDKLPNLQRALLPILESMQAHETIREDRELPVAVERSLEWTRRARG
jgi:hypothetical protein